jgi:hypothetical protein
MTTITGGLRITGGLKIQSPPPGVPYTTMSGYDNGNGWTTQTYGSDTIWIPWTGSGQNGGLNVPTAGQTVRDVNGNTATIDHVNNNNGAYQTKLIYLTASAPGFYTDGIVYIE